MIRADLHVHTYYSDGTQSPLDVVKGALRAGVNLISVTDHDNANGTEEILSLAAEFGLKAVGGEEISAYDGGTKVHLLGYNMDRDCKVFKDFTKKLFEGAEERAEDVLKKLRALGVNISREEICAERYCPTSPVHSFYIAVAGAKKGYEKDAYSFYMRYLNSGGEAFSCVGRPSPEEATQAVVLSGGICSLAHPGRIALEKEGVSKLIRRLIPCGLSGIEAVYSSHTVEQTQYYKELAEKFGLMVTGGSDTHHIGGGKRIGTPAFYPSEELLSALKII